MALPPDHAARLERAELVTGAAPARTLGERAAEACAESAALPWPRAPVDGDAEVGRDRGIRSDRHGAA
jgi:hypothetical protein